MPGPVQSDGKPSTGAECPSMQEELKPQGVTTVERIKRQRDGQLMPTDSYILTINSQNIPSEMKVGFLISKAKVYILNPQRCFASIVKNMDTTRNSVKISKDVRSGKMWRWTSCPHAKLFQVENRTENYERWISKQHLPPWSQTTNWRSCKWPIQNTYDSISKLNQWTNNTKLPNNLKSEEEWLAHTIQSLLKRSDAISAEK